MNSSESILEINCNIIKENYLTICSYCPNSHVGASIKADAYGLGADIIAPILKKAGCKIFFVAFCNEGVSLRKSVGPDVNIYVLHGVFANEINCFLEYNLIPVLNHLPQIKIWNDFATTREKTLPCIIHLDTGMYRLGVTDSEWGKFDSKIDANNLDIQYLMSHSSSSEDISSSSNKEQLDRFIEHTKKLPSIKRSFANSSGVFLGKEYHFDLIRAGAALYGINPTPYKKNSPVKNPFKLLSPIIQLTDLPPGKSVGYNRTHVNNSKNSCKIATIPIGYADGISRSLSNKGAFYINGHKAPIIGIVSMDLTTIDVSNIPPQDLFLGQMVEVIGDNYTPDKIAKDCKTNAYEILTMLGSRYKRIYT